MPAALVPELVRDRIEHAAEIGPTTVPKELKAWTRLSRLRRFFRAENRDIGICRHLQQRDARGQHEERRKEYRIGRRKGREPRRRDEEDEPQAMTVRPAMIAPLYPIHSMIFADGKAKMK